MITKQNIKAIFLLQKKYEEILIFCMTFINNIKEY